MRASTLLALLPLAMAAPAKRSEPAPVLVPRGADVIEGKFIVKMKSGVKIQVVDEALSSISAKADYTYTKGFKGFAATLSDDELKKLKENPDVDFIEQDAVVSITATQSQSGAPWGLARISSDTSGSTTYTYDSTAGAGTCAYVVDTGIDTSHREFEGRATFAGNFVDNTNTDGNGHGTHVAGTIGSRTYGVAKKTSLYAVKVLDSGGSGSNSGVIAGMDFVITDAPRRSCRNGVVVNMSLGGGYSAAINQAAASIVRSGLFLAVAAGNDGRNAANSSPASERTACTVGATTSSDQLATYSNRGNVVDVLAPGSNILSTYPGGRTSSLSGTSMASPHVAGIAAYFLGLDGAPVASCEYIASQALSGVVSGVPSGTPNKLINNGL